MPKFQIQRDPRLFDESWQRVDDPGLKLALCLDLGSSCGYAFSYFQPGRPYELGKYTVGLGQWDLSAGNYDSGAIRFVRLRQFLAVVRPDLVIFEEVRYTPAETPNRINIHAIVARSALPTEWFGALKATVGTWCEEHNIPCQGVPIQHIKKRATGKGNANKEQVIVACNETFGAGLDVEGYENSGADNIADASFALLIGVESYAAGITGV
jgi:crossover junction endodeoxyribonuclease RuvC